MRERTLHGFHVLHLRREQRQHQKQYHKNLLHLVERLVQVLNPTN